jgi:hypothetical protein
MLTFPCSRVWVIQELAVARDVLIQCGPCKMPWEYWDLVIDAYQTAILEPPPEGHLFSWMPPFRRPPILDQPPLNPELSDAISWDAACALRTARRRFQDSEIDHGLASLLIRFRDFQCSNPRDKIYAIYRLSLESAHVKPDYSKSVSEVYMEAVQDSIRDPFQRLSLFSMLDFENRNEALPTWCPNFHAPAPKGAPFYRDGYLSGGRCYTKPEFKNSTMTLPGVTIGKIVSIVDTDGLVSDSQDASTSDKALHKSTKPLLDTLKTLCISWDDIVWIKGQQSTLVSPSSEFSDPLSARSEYFSLRSDSSQAWYSPEVSNDKTTSEYASREDRLYVENYLQKILKDRKTGQDYPPVVSTAGLRRICDEASRQIVAYSDENLNGNLDGNFAHVPLSADVGDELVVFLGAKVPFCIRKVKESSRYYLIGDWYVCVPTHVIIIRMIH